MVYSQFRLEDDQIALLVEEATLMQAIRQPERTCASVQLLTIHDLHPWHSPPPQYKRAGWEVQEMELNSLSPFSTTLMPRYTRCLLIAHMIDSTSARRG